MTRCIGNNEFSPGCGKITVGHINGNALFTFCTQAIRKQGQVDLFFTAVYACLFKSLQLILKYGLAIIQ